MWSARDQNPPGCLDEVGMAASLGFGTVAGMSGSVIVTVGAVLCDMDGTLVDSTAIVEQVWTEFAQQFGLDVEEILATSHGRLTEETVAQYAPAGSDIQLICDELAAAELERTQGIVEIPGAATLMRALTATDVVALVTSAPRALAELRMRAAGIPMPAVTVCAEDVRNGKPDPEGFVKALRDLGRTDQEVVVFEDSEAGIKAGLAAGARVIVVGNVACRAADGLLRVTDLRGVACDVSVDSTGRAMVTLTVPTNDAR